MRQKGFTEVTFMGFFSIFLISFIFITQQLSPYGVPQLSVLDLGLLGGSIIGVGVGCAVFTGLVCVAASILSSVINALAFPAVYALVFIPLVFIFSYVMAKLARGN